MRQGVEDEGSKPSLPGGEHWLLRQRVGRRAGGPLELCLQQPSSATTFMPESLPAAAGGQEPPAAFAGRAQAWAAASAGRPPAPTGASWLTSIRDAWSGSRRGHPTAEAGARAC